MPPTRATPTDSPTPSSPAGPSPPPSRPDTTTPLVLEPNIADPDGFYDELLAAYDGLDADESAALDARLILILCNHVGDRDVIRAALAAARGT